MAMKIRTVKAGINGEAIGYADQKPVFITGALPDEELEIRITEEKERYCKAECEKILTPSAHRTQPACRYFEDCGACPLMIADAELQSKIKKDLLSEALWKYAGIRSHFVRDMHTDGNRLGYRSACKLPVQESDRKLTTGMYVPGTNHYHPIPACAVHDPELEEARIAVLASLQKDGLSAYDMKTMKGLRYLVMRVISHEVQITLVTGRDELSDSLLEHLLSIPRVVSVSQSINTDRSSHEIFGSEVRLLKGKKELSLLIGENDLRLSAEAFFQLNIPQAVNMYEMAVSKIDPCDTLVEAYCGIGAMSLLAKEKAKKIIGIESVPSAVRSAKHNAWLNQAENVSFVCDDAARGLKKILQERRVDTLLADPPRSGMDDAMVDTILHSGIRKIIYISCNPATLAKNLAVLKQEYQVVTVIPYDLFPNTAQVESITVLQKTGTSISMNRKKRRRGKKHEVQK